jgi:transglutaminase-like putative cysteine protease
LPHLSSSLKEPLLLTIYHKTVYRYSYPSTESHNEVRLQPVSDNCQVCKRFTISSAPATRIFSFEELGGTVHYFSLRNAHRSLEIDAKAEVETLCSNPFEDLNLLVPDFDYYDSDPVKHRYTEFLAASRYVSISGEARELAESVAMSCHRVTAQFLLLLNRTLFDRFVYDPDVTHVHSTVDEVFALNAGVCQDFAHVMIACCRSIGIPARYVSGYLFCSEGSGIRGSEAMHAWVECPLPDGRWMALDPTNNLLANEHHIKVHTGRDYADITPLKGLYMGSGHKDLEVEVRVERAQTAQQDIA